MSFSDPLVWSGISGRSSTISSSGLFLCSRLSRRSSMTKPVSSVKMRSNLASRTALLRLTATVGLQSAVVLPDQLTDAALGRAVFVGECVELVNEAFRVNPAQGVQADIELTCVIANDHGVGEKAMGFDASPQRTFGGDQYRIGSDIEGRDAEPVEMGVPGGLVGEISVGMIEKAGDHRASQRSLAHVSDRLIVNHIIAVAGAQHLKEVEAALGARGAEPSEVVVANLCAKAVGGLVACAGVVHRDPIGA